MKASFLPKAGSALAAGGVFGGGGAVIYSNSIPRTWQEALQWEGHFFILSIEEEVKQEKAYKAVYLDNKSNIKNDISEITDSEDESTAFKKIKKWCETKLNEKFVRNDQNTLEKILKYCEDKRPITVEGALKRILDSQEKWLKDETNADEDYKVIFAIYRYSPVFLKEINGSETNKYNQSTSVDEGKDGLKKWCSENLSKKTKEVTDPNLYSYVSWWCKLLGYKTVKEKLSKSFPGWEEELDSSGTDQGQPWALIKGYWQMTREVFSVVDPSKSSKSDGKNIQPTQYMNWCKDKLNKKLYENDVYQRDYLIVKSVCVKQTIQVKLGSEQSLQKAIEASKKN
ncbi:hypothetical protein [Candidatus Mycoplasma haematohominis]|uniref:hypothetical protein n=1 Tax=Candidatus Mycoplasma haematohominis TaxID=1494318 RepID=UPI001C0A68CA|nr:hypothetical protein [Candidatus Mycoplasma haemohominis]